MTDKLVQIADDFWCLCGSFRIGGLVDIGTHASLIRRANGSFIMLDSYPLTAEALALTDGGEAIEAVLNLHPFHTVHCAAVHAALPHAKHYGSDRHVSLFPDLPFEKERVNGPHMTELFGNDLSFSVPGGVDFISTNDNVHFSSVLAFHHKSRTIHVDDTLMVVAPPEGLQRLGLPGLLGFHPTLPMALQHREGATEDFKKWVHQLTADWLEADNIVAAHNGVIRKPRKPIAEQIETALKLAAPILKIHKQRFG